MTLGSYAPFPARLPRLSELGSKLKCRRSLQDDTNAMYLVSFTGLIRSTTWDMLIAERDLDGTVDFGERFRASCISKVQVGMAHPGSLKLADQPLQA